MAAPAPGFARRFRGVAAKAAPKGFTAAGVAARLSPPLAQVRPTPALHSRCGTPPSRSAKSFPGNPDPNNRGNSSSIPGAGLTPSVTPAL